VEIADIDNRGKISLILVADDEAVEATNGEGPASDTDTGAQPADAATASS